jgi:predicted transcriptional regulator of viral defense system
MLADREYRVFAASDLAAAVPEGGHFPGLLSRATKTGLLERVCRGIYRYPVPDYPASHLLFHTAARLRAGEFNSISLETVLSDAGVISQVPMNWITMMTSGRSHVVGCGDYGHIEFVHRHPPRNERGWVADGAHIHRRKTCLRACYSSSRLSWASPKSALHS